MRKPRSTNDAERERSARRRAAKKAAGKCEMCPSRLDGESAQLCKSCLAARRAYLTQLRGYRSTRRSRLKRMEAA